MSDKKLYLTGVANPFTGVIPTVNPANKCQVCGRKHEKEVPKKEDYTVKDIYRTLKKADLSCYYIGVL